MGGIVAWRDITEIKLAQQEVRTRGAGTGAVQPGPGTVRLRGVSRPEGAAADGERVHGPAEKPLPGQAGCQGDEYIPFATDAAVRMQELIDALLAYSRVGRSSATESIEVDPAVDGRWGICRRPSRSRRGDHTRYFADRARMNPVDYDPGVPEFDRQCHQVSARGRGAGGVYRGGEDVRSQGSGVRGSDQGTGGKTGSRKSEATGPADMIEMGVARQPVVAHSLFLTPES